MYVIMDPQKVDMYLMTHSKYFEGNAIPMLRENLLKLDESKFIQLQTIGLKDPTIMLIVSLFGGQLGIDRFMIGDTGLGIAKLLTCGGLGIWAIVDWFMIMGRAKEINLEKINTLFI
jgi:TM2 domain-containing membrane protein YozV